MSALAMMDGTPNCSNSANTQYTVYIADWHSSQVVGGQNTVVVNNSNICINLVPTP